MPKDAQSYPGSKKDDFVAQALNNHSTRRRWSNRILEIEGGFQNSFSKFCALVNWIVDRPSSNRRRKKKRFQFCTNYTGTEILYLRAFQGHSGENPVDPSLLDNVLIPDNVFEFVYSGLIVGGKFHGRDRQTVFLTAVDPMGRPRRI